MKKKFTGILLACLMCAVTVLTGCALVTRNWDRYYNAVVATITTEDGEKIDITKRELITAYSSYGYYYEQSTGDRENALELTLTQLENRKLMLRAAEEKFGFTDDDGTHQVLTDKEKTYLWTQTSNALQDNLLSYVPTEDLPASTQTDNSVTAERYQPQGRLVLSQREVEGSNGEKEYVTEYKIEKTETLAEMLSDFDYNPAQKKDIKKAEDKDQIYQNLITLVESTQDGTYSKAFDKYHKALKSSEAGLKIDENRVTDIFMREIDRIYTINYENYLIEKYSESFKNKSAESDVTVERMLKHYTNKVLSSYNKYAIETSATYEDDVLSDLSKIYYFKKGDDATQFYTVSHILLKFNDAQTALYNASKAELEDEEADHSEIISQLKSLATLTVREEKQNGTYSPIAEKDRQVYETSVDGLYAYIRDTIGALNDPISKAEKFKEFIYKYNEDPGIMNAEYNYVMGVNKQEAADADKDDIITLKDGRIYKSYSQMVPQFTLAGAELFNDGKGKVGDISQLVLTENGFHILMFTGVCDNYFDSIVESYKQNGKTEGLRPGAIETLNAARLNVCTDKTIFDVLYEELTQDNFATFESQNAALLREKCDFDHYVSAYKDLF